MYLMENLARLVQIIPMKQGKVKQQVQLEIFMEFMMHQEVHMNIPWEIIIIMYLALALVVCLQRDIIIYMIQQWQ